MYHRWAFSTLPSFHCTAHTEEWCTFAGIQMQDDTAPATIDIKVTTDVEGDSAKGVPYPGADREIDPYKRSDGGMV